MKKSLVLSNLFWKFGERFTAQLVSFVVSIVLARIIAPEDYGILAIVNIFITLANVFVSNGLGSALIQKVNADADDFSAVLYVNIAFSIVLYTIIFFTAPFITKFYGTGYEMLTPVLRILGLRIILTGINSIQQAYIAKKMMFKKFFFATLFGTIMSAIVGIIMALREFGVWALVFQYLTNTTVDTIVLVFSIHKIPRLTFKWQRVKSLLPFGLRILETNILITTYQELRAVIIGKVYSSADLAFYDKGKQVPSLLVTNINSSIDAVLFPKMSAEQDNLDAVCETTRKSIRFGSFILSPMMLGLLAISETLVRLLLTDKWLPCVPFLQTFCIIYLFQPVHTANMQAIKAIGRSDVFMRLECIKKPIELFALLCVMHISVHAIVISMAVLTTLFLFLNAYPNSKLLKYPIKKQLTDIGMPIIMGAVMAGVVLIIGKLHIYSLLVKLIVQILMGGSVYILLSMATHNPEFRECLSLMKNITYK